MSATTADRARFPPSTGCDVHRGKYAEGRRTGARPGGKYLITAKVTVRSGPPVGSKVTGLVTLTSGENETKKDAVKFTGKRA
jgi:hypothetical protein